MNKRREDGSVDSDGFKELSEKRVIYVEKYSGLVNIMHSKRSAAYNMYWKGHLESLGLVKKPKTYCEKKRK